MLDLLKTLSVILPCFNEAKNIPIILESFKKVLNREDVELIFVDNGSTDNTQKVFNELLPQYSFAKCAKVDVNKGYGFGILSGLKIAQGKYLGWTHSDTQTDLGDILRGLTLIETSSDPTNTYIKGLRRGRLWADEFFTIGMSIFESLILWTPMWDINAQPNIFPRKFFEKWQNAPFDFSFDLYYYYVATKNRYKIKRFDVKFSKRLHGRSSWNVNWKSKLRFIFRTISFTLKLKHKLKTDEKI